MRKAPFILTLALVLALTFCSIIGTAAPDREEPEVHKYYTSITIQPGDTLWSVARQTDPEGHMDVRDHVNELMRINRMAEPDLKAGMNLTVFYYDTAVK